MILLKCLKFGSLSLLGFMNLNKISLLSGLFVSATFLVSPNAQALSTIAGWTFESDSIAVNNTPSADTGVGTASSINMDVYATPNVGVTTDDVLVGTSANTGANGIADLTNTWRIRAQGGANTPANGWSSAAPIGTQGVQFAASTAGYSNINISFDWYTTKQGEANLQLQYTTDGSTWINTAINIGTNSSEGLAVLTNSTSANTVDGSYISDNLKTNGSLAGSDWFTGLTATISDPSAANDSNFAIRLVNASTGTDDVNTQGTALNNNSGNWQFDNVEILGTQTAQAVPFEFSPENGFVLGVPLFLGLRQFKKRKLSKK